MIIDDIKVGDFVHINNKVVQIAKLKENILTDTESKVYDYFQTPLRLVKNSLSVGDSVRFRETNYRGKKQSHNKTFKDHARVISFSKNTVTCELDGSKEVVKCSVWGVSRFKVLNNRRCIINYHGKLVRCEIARGGLVDPEGRVLLFSSVKPIPFKNILRNFKIKKEYDTLARETMVNTFNVLKSTKGVQRLGKTEYRKLKNRKNYSMYSLVVKRGDKLIKRQNKPYTANDILETINTYSTHRPERYDAVKEYYGYEMVRMGNVFGKEGSITKLSNFLKRQYPNKITRPKSPIKKDRYIGLEIEQCSPLDRKKLEEILVAANLDGVISTTTDGSLRPNVDDYGLELRLLIKENEIEETITKVCDVLKYSGSYVNRSCGLHVHLDMRTRNVSNCYNNLVNKVSSLLKLCTPDRVDNEYCSPPRARTFKEAVDKIRKNRYDRYSGINALSYERHKSLEVRYLHGTLDAKEIIRWVKYLIEIIDEVPVLNAEEREIINAKIA